MFAIAMSASLILSSRRWKYELKSYCINLDTLEKTEIKIGAEYAIVQGFLDNNLIITYADDSVITDIDKIVGSTALTTFGEYEDDSVNRGQFVY